MKKVIIALAFVSTLFVTSCSESTSTEVASPVDSTACCVPTSTVTVTDTTLATDTIK